jgi:hypothetical protein
MCFILLLLFLLKKKNNNNKRSVVNDHADRNKEGQDMPGKRINMFVLSYLYAMRCDSTFK